MKFKVGDRIRYCNKNSEHDGRTGLVITVADENVQAPYYVSLDRTKTCPLITFWTRENVLEPYIEISGFESVGIILSGKETKKETFRDRLKREYPERVNSRYIGGCRGCPYKYRYEPKPKNCDSINEISCRKCWDRPIPANTDINIYKTTNIITYKRSVCKCGDSICSDYKYCPHCGIKLDWSE